MTDNRRLPTVPKLKPMVEALFNDATRYYNHDDLADELRMSDAETAKETIDDLHSRFSSPITIVDPRYLGYSFPSYTFIETKNNLESGTEANRNHFDSPDEAMLLGTVLGDVDLIHRRVDADRWANADFAKWAKARLNYFERFETYPIFQIARWHGKDRDSTLKSAPRSLTKVEQDVLTALRADPRLWENNPGGDNPVSTDGGVENNLDDYKRETVQETIRELREDDILLGTSISYDLYNSPWNCAVMGLSLGREDNDDESSSNPRMDLMVDHDHVIDELQELDTEYLNKFTMPFITAGVGQGWADILLELRIENSYHLDEIAKAVRDIKFVETTKTYYMTSAIYNEPVGL